MYSLLIKILEDNKQKCAIYKRVYRINGKSYVGSFVNLNAGLSSYLSIN